MFSSDLPLQRKLYHYTKPDTLLLILQSLVLRLSPFTRMSDPRERREWRPSVSDDVGLGVDNDEFWQWQQELDQALRSRIKITCFTRDRYPSGDFHIGQFHRGYARARMWEQYATHSGAVLIFDQQRLLEAASTAFCGKGTLKSGAVSYEDRPVQAGPRHMLNFRVSDLRRDGADATAVRFLHEHWRDLYLSKNLDWRSEEEFRLLLIDDDREAHREFALGDALEAVVVGEDFADLDALTAVLDSHVLAPAIGRCVWFGGSPQVLPVGT